LARPSRAAGRPPIARRTSSAASLSLSPRESEVLAWLAGGKTNRAIAEILGLSPIAIKHCVERIYGKLDVRTRAAATAIAIAAAGSLN
jgi:DNA-binding CsgD family transcriptional regulator